MNGKKNCSNKFNIKNQENNHKNTFKIKIKKYLFVLTRFHCNFIIPQRRYLGLQQMCQVNLYEKFKQIKTIKKSIIISIYLVTFNNSDNKCVCS